MDDDDGGGGKGRRGDPPPRTGRPAARPPASVRKRRAPEPTKNTAPPRRWWEQPWLWFGLIVALVGASLALSFAVNSDPEDVMPSGDTTAFCAAVSANRQATSTGAVSLDASAPDLEKLYASFDAVRQASPDEIRSTLDHLTAALREATTGLAALQGQPDGADRSGKEADLLDQMERQNGRWSERYFRYVRRACGIDLTAEISTTTAPTTSSSVPAGVVVPSPPEAPTTTDLVGPVGPSSVVTTAPRGG